MIDRIENFLKKYGIISPFTEDDMINASTEDKLREHETLVQKAQGALHARLVANDQVRASIKLAADQTTSFADFERAIVRREGKAS